MGVFCLIVFLILELCLKIFKKNDLLLLFVYLSIGPLIKISGFSISPSYFVLMICIIKMFLYKKKSNNINNVVYYLILAIICSIIYCFPTLMYSKFIFSTIQSFIGIIKTAFIVYILVNYSKIFEKDYYYYIFNKLSWILIVLNLFAGVIQILKKDAVLNFFRILYSNGNDYYMTVNGKYCYSRIFGLYANSMTLGIVALSIFTFLLMNSLDKKKLNVVQLVLCLILGILSSSKTFILGVPIVLILYYSKLIISKNLKIQKKFIGKIILLLLLLPFVVMFIFKFIGYLSDKGLFIKYYLNYLKNPLEAFSTRYSNESDILLSQTYLVIKQHLLFGVGLNSISGEFIGDSTYVLALHNGGLVCLILTIIFYFKELIRALSFNRIIFIIIWILTGFALPTLFNSTAIIPFIVLYYIRSEVVENDKIFKKNC